MEQQIDSLVPVEIRRRYEAVPGYIGKLEQKDVLVTRSGTVICRGLSISWLKYIKEAINHYKAVAQQARNTSDSISSDMAASFEIQGEAMPIGEGRRITQDENGAFILMPNKAYSIRIRQVLKQKQEIMKTVSCIVPITFPVHVRCVFYFKNKTKKDSIPSLVSGTLDILQRLGIIKSINSDVVASTDGSAIRYALGEPKTIVTIRKMREGYTDGRT